MTTLSNQEIMDRVKKWQNTGHVHPLTCGKDSSHPNLEAKEVNGKVILYCTACDYRQKHIPQVVLSGPPELPKFN